MDSLGSWLTPSLPTGAPEKLVRDWAARLCRPLYLQVPAWVLRAIDIPLSLASARAPSIPYPVFAPKQWWMPLSLEPATGRIISLCAGLPLVSMYTGPEGVLGDEVAINHCGSLSQPGC